MEDDDDTEAFVDIQGVGIAFASAVMGMMGKPAGAMGCGCGINEAAFG